MAISTYTELTAAVADWLNKSNLTSYIPTFIKLAEADFNRRLRIRGLETTETGSFSTSTLDLSSVLTRYQEIKLVTVANSSEYWIQNYVSPQQFWQLYNDTATGQPRDYTTIGDTMHFGPAPDSSYTWTIWYYQRAEDIQTASTNTVLTNHPDIYLYGSLVAAEPFLKNDSRLATWKLLYESCLESANLESNKRHLTGTSKQTSEMGVI